MGAFLSSWLEFSINSFDVAIAASWLDWNNSMAKIDYMIVARFIAFATASRSLDKALTDRTLVGDWDKLLKTINQSAS